MDGILPSDRPHYFKAFGSYAFPFGLTVGFVGYGRSGLPMTTSIELNDMQIVPGRLQHRASGCRSHMWADLYLEYNLRIAKRYKVNLNPKISNVTNTSTDPEILHDGTTTPCSG